jgi:serine-type D-Ala-D-Ala carboxypeptidase (penicillin-binding protein 5/6)
MKRFLPFVLSSLLVISLVPSAPAATTTKKSSSTTSSTTKKAPAKKPTSKTTKKSLPEPPASTDARGVPVTSAGSVIVVDAANGNVLHAVNADQRRPVASTQKLLTALIVAETGNLDGKITVEASDTWAEPTKLYIKPGDVYSRYDFVNILLVHSMNDVARALARDNAGSQEAFADKMNARAAQMGMHQSNFVNPNGLPAAGQYSTARDMARLALYAYRNRTLRSIMCQKSISFRYSDGRVRNFDNTNRVLRNFGPCNGMKTGTTDAAGRCLISSGSHNGRDIIVVVLGDNRNIWNDSYRLLAWGLSS